MKIELVPWDDANLDAVASVFTRTDHSHLSDSMPIPFTRQHAEDWFERNVLPRDGKTGLYRVILAGGSCAGIITLDCKSDIYRRDSDIGYLLLPEYSGMGVMTEALRLFCREAFQTLDLMRITARVFSPNAASRRVLEKNGFVPEGTMRKAVCRGESVCDLCIYGKLKGE